MIYLFSAVAFLVAYLIGSVNGAIIMSHLVFHEDIRTQGSKNPGFTNYKRVHGYHWSTFCVIAIDVGKTIIPVLISALILKSQASTFSLGQDFCFKLGAQAAGLGCMIGHSFPLYYKFKGGKAFLSECTVVWFVDWRAALICAAIFFTVIFIFHFMSLSSIVSSFSYPFVLLAILKLNYWPVILLAGVGAILVIVRHHANIKRLIQGTESKFYFHKKA